MKRIRFIFLFLLSLLFCLSTNAQEQTQYTNLPTVYITTTNKAAVTTKKTFINATWTLVDGDQTETISGLKIRCRGNSTFNSSGATKKAYRLKFSQPVSLLGDKGAKAINWVLMANHYDKTMLRNALTSCIMARFLDMEFCPGARFVDLVLNDKYVGTYQITDHPDAVEGRLDVDTPQELQEGEEASEGFFLEADGWEDHKVVKTSKKSVPIRIHKPKDGEVTTEQANYVKNWIDRFETALFSDDFRDPVKGYRPLVDSVSLANLYVATEMCANIDGFFSTYLYKKANDQKLYFGPLWDYDIAYANDTRKGDTSKLLMSNDGYGAARVWFARMWRDPWFRQLIYNRWTEAQQKGLQNRLLTAVDSMAAVIDQSQALNFDLYGISTKVYNERVMHSTYAEYINDLKNFITVRTAYLNEEFKKRSEEMPSDLTGFQLISNYYYRIQSAGVGTYFDIVNEGLKEGNKACLWSLDKEHRTQQWSIRRVGDAYQFINRASGLALNESSEALQTQLSLAQPNENSDAQLWTIVLADEENDYFNIINKAYNRTANVSGGGSSNGTALIAWESNEKNQTSKNRQWYIIPDEINSDSIVLTNDINQMFADTLAIYKERVAKETPGTEVGQVSQSSIDAINVIITEAEAVIAEDRLNINLANTYIYYLQRAWKAVLDSKVTMDPNAIDYNAEGNYRLFWRDNGASVTTSAKEFESNDDAPWGFYAYNVEAGTYDRFDKYDNNGKCGSATERGKAWYRAQEYCFVSSTGHFHACTSGVNVKVASPAIVFTAPKDGIYYVTITVRRDKANQTNTLYLRSRYLKDGLMECAKEDCIFDKAYGTAEIDGTNGQTPQTLDFYVRMKQGDRVTLEDEAYTSGSESSGRTIITDLSITSGYNAEHPYTLEEAEAHPRFYDAVAVGIGTVGTPNLNTQGNVIYDLSGRPLTKLTHPGIYIQGGRKIVR